MKFTKIILTAFAGFCIAASSFGAGLDTGYPAFAGGGTQFNASSLTNYAVIPDFSKTPNAQGLLSYLNATSDKTGSVVQFFSVANATPIYDTNWGFTNLTTTSNYYVGSTNLMAIGTNIVIKHNITNGPPAYELAQVFGLGLPVYTNIVGPPSAPSTNFIYAITNTTPGLFPFQRGDTVFAMIPAGSIPIVSVNVALSLTGGAGGLYSTQQGAPGLLEITGGTNATINAFSGTFIQ